MRWLRRVVVVLAGAAAAALVAATPSWAAGGDVGVSVRADDPLAPVVVLTNHGTAPCQMPTTSLGTLAFASVRQGSTAITPIVFEPGFDESLDQAVQERLRTLAAGASVDIKLPVVAVGPTGHALETVTWTGNTAPSGAFYPIAAGQPLQLQVSYTWSLPPRVGPPLCGSDAVSVASPQPSVLATAPSSKATGWRYVIWAGIAVVVIAVILGAVLLRSRAKRAKRAGAAIIIALAGLLAPAWHAKAAEARIRVNDPSLQQAFDDCMAVLHQPGHDPAGILPTLEGNGVTVQLEVPSDGVTHEGGLGPNFMIIFWNTNDHHQYVGSGGAADPCTALYHEFYHAWEDTQGIQDHDECVTEDGHHTGIGINEVHATREQNRLLQALGRDQRDHYGDRPLPTSDCRPSQPDDPICTDQGCAASRDEPHLTTFDGRRYDFQAVGEFVAARDTTGDFQIQVRQQPYSGSTVVAVNTAIAVKVGDQRVEVQVDGSGLRALVDGVVRTGEQSDLSGGGQLRVHTTNSWEIAIVTWPDGSTAWITSVNGLCLNLSVQPAPSRKGHLEGLLGDFDGNPSNDIRSRGGAPYTGAAKPTYAVLYPALADSWRVDASSSLFTYPQGKNTDSYTDRSYPHALISDQDLSNRAAAEAICRHFGVTEAALLSDCILDVGLTGQASFAEATRAGQAFETGVRSGATVSLPATADIYLAGAGPIASLPGGAGTLPMRVMFDPATVHNITFPKVIGLMSPYSGGTSGPDGGTEYHGTNIDALNGISGVIHQTKSLFLVGVFLPASPSPTQTAKPDVTGQEALTQVLPKLGELFAIGDGRTAQGTLQHFVVPAGATRLYIGFADAGSFRGSPGSYGDNTGALAVQAALS